MSTKNPTKHTAIALTAANKIEAIEVPTRSPGADEVLIKVDYASYGAGDAHAVDDNFEVFGYPEGLGFVATGKIVEVGKNVEGLKEGDEVGAFTQPGADRGLQQYVVAPANRVSKIPSNIQPQDVAAVLDNFVTACMSKISELVKALGSKVAVLVPIKLGNLKTLTEGGGKLVTSITEEMVPFSVGVEAEATNALHWEQDPNMKEKLLRQILPALLESGDIKPQPVQVINKGSLLERVQEAAQLVRTNQLRGTKAVIAVE
ncbi:hypothetical protein FRB90_000276 [Tulasnella sp. 427]|nr:hypothetical protein FRB90_000276 [Tulasnella sp. 427]